MPRFLTRAAILAGYCIVFIFPALAQAPKIYPAGELQLALKKLNTVGTALYVAAHPDDENTAMLAYLANERLVRTAYLSLTRGDGGQNLIGTEQSELLGLIRTQELLQARRVDGAEQFFSRANDFGFSKSTAEALQVWGKDKILADVVWTIRKLKPDVIITRFPPDSRAGHGHHSASAALAIEAFSVAADPKRFPEQLQYVQPWQAKRVVWNSFNRGFTNQAPDTLDYVTVNVGKFNPLLGKSYTEIAGESRSMHKSQGFGSARGRGERIEYLRHRLGEKAEKDLFDGVDLSWKRIPGSAEVSATLRQAYETFKPENPAASVPLLLQAYRQLEKLPAGNYWVNVKKAEIQEVIIACAGLWYEANASTYAASPGSQLKVTANVVKQSEVPVHLKIIQIQSAGKDSTINASLKPNTLLNLPLTVQLPANMPVTQPYWLVHAHGPGTFDVRDQQLIGQPEKEPEFSTRFNFEIDGVPFTLTKPVRYKWTDPVEGELYRPFEIGPPVTANLSEQVYMFPAREAKEVSVILRAGQADARGEVRLKLPGNWSATPQSIPFTFQKIGEERKVTFRVNPPADASTEMVSAEVQMSDGRTYSQGYLTIRYNHIPAQTLYPEARARIVRLDVLTAGRNIGYIMGAGDEVPAALRQIGYQVTLMNENDLKQDQAYLNQFDAIVTGVRAYNTLERLPLYQDKLMNYVKDGGTVVVQYNTSGSLVTENVGPYRLNISRERVSVEDAPVEFLKPKHPVLNVPNKITRKDFDNWVQERGLYFADKWDSTHYEPVIVSFDPGEKPQAGGLLVANHGKGRFVYTGYSFFRQLPAGVPGAYRLFANLISGGQPKLGSREGVGNSD